MYDKKLIIYYVNYLETREKNHGSSPKFTWNQFYSPRKHEKTESNGFDSTKLQIKQNLETIPCEILEY